MLTYSNNVPTVEEIIGVMKTGDTVDEFSEKIFDKMTNDKGFFDTVDAYFKRCILERKQKLKEN
jgi:hypothetical protein